jgi:hypothetical protein
MHVHVVMLHAVLIRLSELVLRLEESSRELERRALGSSCTQLARTQRDRHMVPGLAGMSMLLGEEERASAQSG